MIKLLVSVKLSHDSKENVVSAIDDLLSQKDVISVANFGSKAC
jgi:hypothetical protein